MDNSKINETLLVIKDFIEEKDHESALDYWDDLISILHEENQYKEIVSIFKTKEGQLLGVDSRIKIA